MQLIHKYNKIISPGPVAGGPKGSWIRRPLACKGAERVKSVPDPLPRSCQSLRGLVPLILPHCTQPSRPRHSKSIKFVSTSYRLRGDFFVICLPRASKSLQEAIQNRISFSASFFDGFWLQLGPNLAPTCPQLGAKILPKSLPRAIQDASKIASYS